MPEYIVKSALKHDGELFDEGDAVEMSAAAAKPLIEAGVLQAKAAKKDEKKEPEKGGKKR